MIPHFWKCNLGNALHFWKCNFGNATSFVEMQFWKCTPLSIAIVVIVIDNIVPQMDW